jgi:hypothetical protein
VRRAPAPRHRQRGAALLLLLTALIFGGAILAARLFTNHDPVSARTRAQAAALAAAREALLGYATLDDPARPGELGFLPCPDSDASGGFAEGEAHAGACGARYRTVQGRLPWRTLGLAPRDGGTECLWYAVSGSHKAATTTRAELLNPDSNGQLRVVDATTGLTVAGVDPADRVVAVIMAPGPPLAGQVRTLAGGGATARCGGSYTAAAYLEALPALGAGNVALAGLADAVTTALAGAPARTDANDQVVYITRAELAARIARRADLPASLDGLANAVARCLADHARRNPGGAGDHRLPWPAPVTLPDYRAAGSYDDVPLGALSGRVPDRVNDSNLRTGNPVARVLTNCDPVAVPEWTATRRALWAHWKDHLFYAVARDFRPDAAPTASCGTCLRVNGSGAYAAVLLFAGPRLAALGQRRDAPPDPDTRGDLASYLEGRNAANHPNATGDADYESGAATTAFNDRLTCIRPTLEVLPC